MCYEVEECSPHTPGRSEDTHGLWVSPRVLPGHKQQQEDGPSSLHTGINQQRSRSSSFCWDFETFTLNVWGTVIKRRDAERDLNRFTTLTCWTVWEHVSSPWVWQVILFISTGSTTWVVVDSFIPRMCSSFAGQVRFLKWRKIRKDQEGLEKPDWKLQAETSRTPRSYLLNFSAYASFKNHAQLCMMHVIIVYELHKLAWIA